MPKLETAQKNEPSSLKIPPHSIEAEQSVLGGLMLDNGAWDKVIEWITEDDFYRYDHKLIFRAIRKLADQSQPLDVITLSEALSTTKELDQVGGLAYLIELAENTPSATNVGAYAEIVRERSIMRQLIAAANKIAEQSFNPAGRTSNELVDEAERVVFQIAEQGQRGSGPLGIQKVLRRAIQRIDSLFHNKNAVTGLSTGFTDLDEMTSGLHPGDLVIVAGRPSMGKTTFAINIVEHVAIKTQKPVLFFSLEMPSDQIVIRMLSSLGQIIQSNLRTGHLSADDWVRVTSSVSLLTETKLFIDETPGISPTEMRARARRVVREHGEIGLIVVDYLQLMQVPGNKENRTSEISEISRSLKLLAKELSVPVIALSQLNRELEHRPNKRPIMSDLRESGAIEQDADLIAFVYRDEVYNKESEDKGKAEIIIGKQRNGPIGTVSLSFQGQYCRFVNFASPQEIG